jgi:Na+-transporting NADH:ubiquinone oxidoreductase subunit NqrC
MADDTIALGRWRFARESPGYTLAFAAVVCIVCALLVAIAAVSLQPRPSSSTTCRRTC